MTDRTIIVASLERLLSTATDERTFFEIMLYRLGAADGRTSELQCQYREGPIAQLDDASAGRCQHTSGVNVTFAARETYLRYIALDYGETDAPDKPNDAATARFVTEGEWEAMERERIAAVKRQQVAAANQRLQAVRTLRGSAQRFG